MSICNKEQAKLFRKLLPPNIAEHIADEEENWKRAIFSNIKKYIKENDPAGIENWLNCLKIYSTFPVFSLDVDELNEIAQILFDFIITSKYYGLVIVACNLFTLLVEPKISGLELSFPWRPVYELMYDCTISLSKTKDARYPVALTDTLVIFTRFCRGFWSDEATEEMWNEFKPLLDPHNVNFFVGLSLLLLFLPVGKGKHNIWLTEVYSLWTLYRFITFDFPFFELFARLSRYGFQDIPWENILPFIFHATCYHMKVPCALLDIQMSSLSLSLIGYSTEICMLLYYDQSLETIVDLFTSVIVNLISGPTRELTRSLLTKLMQAVAYICTTQATNEDEAESSAAPLYFLDSLIRKYTKRINHERKYASKLEPLTEEDHMWFVEILTPLIVSAQFHENSQFDNLSKFIQLCPETIVPKFIESIKFCYDLKEITLALKISCIHALSSLMPSVIYKKVHLGEYLELIKQTINEVSLDNHVSSLVFNMMFSLCSIFEFDINFEPVIIKLVDICIEFATHATGQDYEIPLSEMCLMLSRLLNSIPKKTVEKVSKAIFDKISDIPDSSLVLLVETVASYAHQKFFEYGQVLNNVKTVTVMKGLFRSTFMCIKLDLNTIADKLIGLLNHDEKEVREQVVPSMKWLLRNLINTFPYIPEQKGYVNIKDFKLRWHIPCEEEILKSVELGQKFLAAGSDLLQQKEKTKQCLGVSVIRAVIKGLLSLVDVKNRDVIPDPPHLDQPDLYINSDTRVSDLFFECIKILYESLSNKKLHSNALEKIILILEFGICPEDPIVAASQYYLNEYDDSLVTGRVVVMKPTLECISPNSLYTKSLYLCAVRVSLNKTYYTETIKSCLEKMFALSLSPYKKIQNAATSFIATASLVLRTQFLEMYEDTINRLSKAEELNDEEVTGLTSTLLSIRTVQNNSSYIELIFKVALAVCFKVNPNNTDALLAVSSLRQNIVVIVEQFSGTYFEMDLRIKMAKEAMRRCKMYITSRETQNYAVALVCSVVIANPLIIEPDIFEFFIGLLKTDDKILRDCIIQILPGLIEKLIPREPRPRGIEVDEVTAENYDQVEFKDKNFPRQARRRPVFLTQQELCDEKVMKKYFGDNAAQHVKINKLIIERLYINTEVIDILITNMVDGQVEKEESFIEASVMLWNTFCRFLGPEFAEYLIKKVKDLINSGANASNHAIAGEIMAGVIQSIKSRPFSYVERLIEHIRPFISIIVNNMEIDFSSFWYLSFFSIFNKLDPRRFFWIFDEMINCLPKSPTPNNRNARSVSLVVDIALDVGYKIPKLAKVIEEICASTLFNDKFLEYEQNRECSVRALMSFLSIKFDINKRGNDPEIEEFLNKFFKGKLSDPFCVLWSLSNFDDQSKSSLAAGKFTLDHLHEFLNNFMNPDETQEQNAKRAAIGILCSNWLGSIGSNPLTPESGNEITKKVIDQIFNAKNEWQIYQFGLVLCENFLSINYFYVTDELFNNLVDKCISMICPTRHPDIQDSASQLLSYLIRNYIAYPSRADMDVENFKAMLNNKEDSNIRVAGAKGLRAIISGTIFFDDVPNYLIEAFQALKDRVEIDKTVEPTVSDFFKKFWQKNENNLRKNASRMLAPFRDSTPPSYVC